MYTLQTLANHHTPRSPSAPTPCANSSILLPAHFSFTCTNHTRSTGANHFSPIDNEEAESKIFLTRDELYQLEHLCPPDRILRIGRARFTSTGLTAPRAQLRSFDSALVFLDHFQHVTIFTPLELRLSSYYDPNDDEELLLNGTYCTDD
jgi:hypothetical protein